MVVLNEALVRVKTKQEDLNEVNNLNVCGQGIDDISILQHMPNIEVLSLSVNKIGSLRYFAFCSQLKQLYLRANAVHNLADVRYLMSLRDLKVLWLADNPCTKLPHYRAFVVANLPGLENLDNVAVNDADRQAAKGIRLLQAATAADVAAEDEAADAQAQAEEDAGCTPQHTPLPSTTPRQQLPSISSRPSSAAAASSTPLPPAAAPPCSTQRRRSLSRPASPSEQQQQQSYTGSVGAQEATRRRSSHTSATLAATAAKVAGSSTLGSATAAVAGQSASGSLRCSPEPPVYVGNAGGGDSSLQQLRGCSVTPRDLGYASSTGITASPGEMADTTSRQLFAEHSASHMSAQQHPHQHQHQQELGGQLRMCPSPAEQGCSLTSFGPSVPYRVQQLQQQQQQQVPLQMPPCHASHSPVPSASRTNVLYAVMALLGELDASGLSIVQREVQMRLMEHH